MSIYWHCTCFTTLGWRNHGQIYQTRRERSVYNYYHWIYTLAHNAIGRQYLRNKTSVPVFYREYNIGTSSGAYELKHKCASTRILITRTRTSTDILFCDKTRVPMFYFDSNTARPIVLYTNIDLKLRNKSHGPMHYKIGVTCVYIGHVFYTLL